MSKKTLMIEGLKNGTVIDHIPAGQALRLTELLKLTKSPHTVMIGLHLDSHRLGKKDIIKIRERYLTAREREEIAIFAEKASINVIHDDEITEKLVAELPKEIYKIFICPNDRCITNAENIDSHFYVDIDRGDIKLSCHYCEHVYSRREITRYKT